MLISLVSPVYNEALVIGEFVRRAQATLASFSEDYEIVLVNDCSTDGTRAIIESLKPKIPQLRVVTLSRNSGQHAATVIGLKRAEGDFIFLMDSDLQVAPEDMKTLYGAAGEQDSWDIISGCRMERSSLLIRSVGSRLVSKIINLLTGTKLKDPGSTFLLLTRKAREEICKYDILAQNLQILTGFLGLKVLETPVAYHENRARKSSYRLRDLPELLIIALLNFTTGRTTLLALLAIGFSLFLLGSGGVFYLTLKGIITQSALQTNLLIFFLFLLLVGMQFIFLGIIAFKIERINKNLDFRKMISHELEE
jgi:glycosyltransferase involved in cell wall biosynthesis